MAVTALALFIVFMTACGMVRTWLHWRLTGDTGDRRRAARRLPAQRWVDLLGGVGSLTVGVAAPVAVLAGLAPAAVLAPVSILDRPLVMGGGLVLAILGTAAAFGAQQAMGSSWRVGIDPDERTALVTSGVFRIVRNPILICTLATFAGLTLMVPSVLALAGLALMVAGVQAQVRLVEEPSLSRTHGDAYRRYAARVGRFMPGIGRLR